MNTNNMQYWQNRYLENSTAWDLGEVAPPLKAYFDQLKNKDIKILIPGAGNAHEAEYLHHQGFTNIFVVDWAAKAIENLQARIPSFPAEHLYVSDFFALEEKFDLIIEQTFFCALNPTLRSQYVEKMHRLLNPKGKLVGLLFQIPLNTDKPPFGGDREQYQGLFSEKFTFHTFETAHNSIQPRNENELFFIFQKK